MDLGSSLCLCLKLVPFGSLRLRRNAAINLVGCVCEVDLESRCFSFNTLLAGGRISSFQTVLVVDGGRSLFLDSLVALDMFKFKGFENSSLPPTRRYCLNICTSLRDWFQIVHARKSLYCFLWFIAVDCWYVNQSMLTISSFDDPR